MHISVRVAIVATALASAPAAHAQSLTLQDAIQRAVEASPQGEAASARQDVLTAARAQADTRPAASIDFMAENLGIGGSAEHSARFALHAKRCLPRRRRTDPDGGGDGVRVLDHRSCDQGRGTCGLDPEHAWP